MPQVDIDGLNSTLKADVIRGQAATSTKLGGDLDLNGNDITGTGSIPAVSAQKNLIINGDFNVWQRGTSFAACSDNEYQADRFKYSKVGAMVHTISRDTDVPTVAESGHLSNYSLKVDCTTIDSSIAAGDECHIFHSIEGYNFKCLAQKAMTLSFWHKHTKTGTYCVSFRNTGHNQSYVAEYTQSVTDTWEKATINISASPTGGTWDYTNGVGIKIGWSIAMGSNFHTTADAWAGSSRAATSNQVNACDNAANNFMLSQVQLEAGSVATDFEVKNYADELARCKRYYERINSAGLANFFYGQGQANTTTAAKMVFNWEVEKRVAPTMSMSAASDFMLTEADEFAQDMTNFEFSVPSVSSVRFLITSSGASLTAGHATIMRDDGNGNSWVDAAAEL